MRKLVRIVLWSLLAVVILFAGAVALNWNVIQRVFLGGLKVYETTPPVLPAEIRRPAILVFSKTNAFRHEEAIPAANAMFAQVAKEKGWGYYQTENGATFSPEILARFDAVVFNNVSGDVFTPTQQAAFKAFVERGGGYLGIHAAGDSSHNGWAWYTNEIIGAQFTSHPMSPQFQQARVVIEDKLSPATQGLPPEWRRTDEWYSFKASPRAPGISIVATLDEATYQQKGPFGQDLKMGADHPIVWSSCVGSGRAFYSAMGHTAESFSEPNYRTMLLGATNWVLRKAGDGCNVSAPKGDSLKQ